MDTLITYLIIVWFLWLILVSFAVYQKWKKKKELMFYLTYALLGLAFAMLIWIAMSLPGNTSGYASIGGIHGKYLILIKNFPIMLIMTIFLQISVWWFTNRWHRK